MDCRVGTIEGRVSGSGTWDREARRVTLLASELHLALDPETLLLYDVRDLLSLRVRLQRKLARRARRAMWRL